jgi:uncharacterized protein YodC (DUF2158 family)
VADKYSVGDTVRLKSGGPVMTVSGIQDGQLTFAGKRIATCIWWGESRYETVHLDIELLNSA